MSTAETSTSALLSTVEPLDDRGSAVRFETQCIVIPDPAHRSRRPRVVTKSYSLPLWKRRTPSPSSVSAPPEEPSSEENQSHIVLRVPLPTLSLRPQLAARAIDHTTLTSCLVHRAQPSDATPSQARHARASRKPSPSPSRIDVVTIPLRPCCTACQPITDAAFVGGDAWTERFSRSASRRHSMSTDGRPRTITVAGSAASASYGTLGVSINVDEIDKRRRLSDSATTQEALSHCAIAPEECRMPSIHCQTAASSSSTPDVCSPSTPARITPSTPRIPEEQEDEDEDKNELFPLPSPKRTPTISPAPSPAGSLSSLMAAQANQIGVTSSTPSPCSEDSTDLHSSKRHFLAPPTCSSSSSLSLPKLSESMTDLSFAEDPPRVPSPNLLSTLPPLSGRFGSRSSSPRISHVPATPTDSLSSAVDGAPKTPQSPESVYVPVSASTSIPPSPGPSQLSSSPHHSPTHMRFPWRSKRSVSADVITLPSAAPSSPSASPTLSSSPNTKKVFSMSSSRHIIADVLRGVGTISSGGIVPRI